jgi:hypothetical protein
MSGINNVILLKNYTDAIGRKYSRTDLWNEYSKIKVMFGELGHGAGEQISLDKVSHQVKNIRQIGDDLVGDIEILETPCGKIVKELLNNGLDVRTSIRAIGTVDEEWNVSDLKLITFDLIVDNGDISDDQV